LIELTPFLETGAVDRPVHDATVDVVGADVERDEGDPVVADEPDRLGELTPRAVVTDGDAAVHHRGGALAGTAKLLELQSRDLVPRRAV
jgi:hypothetical protein